VISVITSVYNTEFALVQRAVESALRQDFQDFEFILIDDGSTNDPQNKLLALAKKHQDKVTFLRHPNRGQAASINRGILLSTAPYITILDADDEYKSGHLSTCLREMANYDLISSNAEIVAESTDQYYIPDLNDNQKMIHVDECILFATLFGKREVFEATDFAGSYGADARFFEEASKRYRVAKLDLRTYVYYRNIPGSISATFKENAFRKQI
jgi:glycosyltransferase involved in cell wall biosynthesis